MLCINKLISRSYLGILQQNSNKVKSFVYSKDSSSGDHKEFYVKWFKKLDSNYDGYITKEELARGFKNILSISNVKKGINDLVKKIDVDKTGLISFEEFIKFVSAQPEVKVTEETAARTFKVFDKDGDGRITRAELVATFSSLGQELKDTLMDQVMKEYDRDGDGHITFEEFKLFLFSKENDDK